MQTVLPAHLRGGKLCRVKLGGGDNLLSHFFAKKYIKEPHLFFLSKHNVYLFAIFTQKSQAKLP